MSRGFQFPVMARVRLQSSRPGKAKGWHTQPDIFCLPWMSSRCARRPLDRGSNRLLPQIGDPRTFGPAFGPWQRPNDFVGALTLPVSGAHAVTRPVGSTRHVKRPVLPAACVLLVHALRGERHRRASQVHPSQCIGLSPGSTPKPHWRGPLAVYTLIARRRVPGRRHQNRPALA